MKEFTMFLFIILAFLSIIGIAYSIFAGIWGFNPTLINYFNLKLGLSLFTLVIILSSLIKAFD